jgi:hypothetical protein
MAASFGIVSEGPTDQIIIQNILVGFFGDYDITSTIRFLQPLRDATDEDSVREKGGWFKVFEYCKSQYIIDAFEQNDFIIIQIDTDVCEEVNFDIKRNKENGDKKSDIELINDVKEKFIEILENRFGKERYKSIAHRIVYAICHNEIECWLLPIYYNDKTKEATNNCIHKLNKAITEKVGCYIDPNNKANMAQQYWQISKPYMKNKELIAKSSENISLSLFIESLQTANGLTHAESTSLS